MSKIIRYPFNTQLLSKIAEELRDVIFKYSGQISAVEAIGLLEIVKLELFEDQSEQS
jgi:hypothetical protein